MSGGDLLRYLGAAVVGYLLGSIPSGVLVGRLFGNVDPRAYGSGKTGATNILRTLGPGPAILVALMDVAKGVVSVLVARFLIFPIPANASVSQHTLQAGAEAIAAFCALLGHNFSIFLHFTGGRGVATGGGGVFAQTPIAGLVGIVCMAIPIALTRYMSLGSITGAATSGIAAVILAVTGHAYWPNAAYAVVGGAFVIYSHKDNIQRLLSGTERKIGQPAVHH
jgi:glycerol-3-phosphate acyltransferase PlsY